MREATQADGLCVFCTVVGGSVDERPPHDRILYSSRHFALVPALGSLVPGHLLLVSREHARSFAAMGTAILSEYEMVFLRYCRHLRVNPWDVLEAEHGATSADRAGSCIEHVHVNLLPGLIDCADVLDSLLPPLPNIGSLDQLATVEVPYALTRTRQALRVYDATGAPSQFIRRRICERLGRDDWDWALFPGHDNIRKTLAMWT